MGLVGGGAAPASGNSWEAASIEVPSPTRICTYIATLSDSLSAPLVDSVLSTSRGSRPYKPHRMCLSSHMTLMASLR